MAQTVASSRKVLNKINRNAEMQANLIAEMWELENILREDGQPEPVVKPITELRIATKVLLTGPIGRLQYRWTEINGQRKAVK